MMMGKMHDTISCLCNSIAMIHSINTKSSLSAASMSMKPFIRPHNMAGDL